MTSQVGSESIDDCRCAPGHFRDGDACSVCPAGHWCAGNADKEPCPGVSTSDVGAVSDQDCKCMPGQFGDPKDENGCLPCDAGYFCSGGTAKTECPVGSMSAAGMTECRCAAGYFGSNWRHCNDCPKNQVSDLLSPPLSSCVYDVCASIMCVYCAVCMCVDYGCLHSSALAAQWPLSARPTQRRQPNP